MPGSKYAQGSVAWGLCNRCGLKFFLRDLVFDGYYPGLRVCIECYDSKQPQEFLVDVTDPEALWKPAPDTVQFTPSVLSLTAGTPGPGNPSLLLHFDGTNGQTSTVDSSANHLPISFSGAAALSTTTPKFGTASLVGTGAAATYISTPVAANGPLDLSNTDFTVQFWAYSILLDSFVRPMVDSGNDGAAPGGWGFQNSSTNGLTFYFGTAVGSNYINTTAMPTGAWHSIAGVRKGNTFGFWVDGVSKGTLTIAGNIGKSTTLTVLAAAFAGGAFDCMIDELQITKSALFTPGTNYTPGTQPFALAVNLAWTVADFQAYTVGGYSVYRANLGGQFALIGGPFYNSEDILQDAGPPITDTLAFTDTTAVSGQVYQYYVQAFSLCTNYATDIPYVTPSNIVTVST